MFLYVNYVFFFLIITCYKACFFFKYKAWLPSSNWDNISELDKLPGFMGIEKSFLQYSKEWKDWFTAPNPETLPLIGDLMFKRLSTSQNVYQYSYLSKR